MPVLMHGIRAQRGTSNYGQGDNYNTEIFTPDPPVQVPNGAIVVTKEICDPGQGSDSCGVDHAFIYQVSLGDTDPGTVRSITLTVSGQNGGIFSNGPLYGVMECDAGGANLPCSPPGTLTDCANSSSFFVAEKGIGTSTYSQTWDFKDSGCPVFGAGQTLAIFVDLRLASDPSPDDGTPYIQPPVMITINVDRQVQFVPVTPCRLVDTRNPTGEFGGPPLQGNQTRSFVIPDNQDCKIPSSAGAYSLNVTAVPHGHPLGYLTVWPTGQPQPLASTLNSTDGRIKPNAAIVPAGTQGAVSFYVTDTTDLVLDIDGYFVPASTSTLTFYPLPPCRVADTRDSNQPAGLGPPALSAQQPRDFPVLNASSCNIPDSAQAYSMNVTAVPHGYLEFVTVWPTGQQRPNASTLNAPTGTVVANAAIVPAGTSGKISVYAYNDTDLILDIDGYFASSNQGGLSLYAAAPCRVMDTRPPSGNGPFGGTLNPAVDVVGSLCEPPSYSEAYVFNATVVPEGKLGYLTLWPDGMEQPYVSTLNAYDAFTTSNMAIVPAGGGGKIDAYAYGYTNLVLDLSGFFAP